MKHFLTDTDFPRESLPALFQLARELKEDRLRHASDLQGQTWGLLFAKSSTRTRVSFEVGLRELGANTIYLEQSTMQMGRGETIGDTARVLSRYLHGLVIRTYGQEIIEEFATAGSIPIVNALTDLLHPCQIYADAFTLAERWAGEGDLFASLAGKKIAFFGDCAANMANSWILGAAYFGMEIALSGPERYAPGNEVDVLLEANDLPKRYYYTPDPREAAEGADALYTDVWVSMGQEAEKFGRIEAMRPYGVTEDLMALAKPTAWFLHCLPAHVGMEVDAAVYEGPRSIVFDEAENRLHMQKAILAHLTGIV